MSARRNRTIELIMCSDIAWSELNDETDRRVDSKPENGGNDTN